MDFPNPDERGLRAERHREAVGTLSTRDVSDLVVSLGADDPKRRASAAWSLAEVAATNPDRVPVPDLAQAADDDDRWVRRGATWALAEVAETDPATARPAVDRVIGLFDDGDPLVRENAAVTVAGVAREYPRAAEPAIAALADLRDSDDGLVRRYATEALSHVVDALSSVSLAGEPVVIATYDDRLAGRIPGDVTVVRTDEGESDDGPVRIAPASSVVGETRTRAAANDEAREPPPATDAISPPSLDAAYDDFEKLGTVGASTLATVHRARVSTPGEPHAVVSLCTLRSDRRHGDLPEAFSRAIRTWRAVDSHDHVLAVRAHGDVPRPWVAVEFADGGSLREHLDAGFEASLWYASCVVRAVRHAHAVGVIHGGLHPGAVGVSETIGPTWGVPKVGDWGFAGAVSDASSPPVPPAFAAPEHLDPSTYGTPDQSTDVYGLGALLYALFTGGAPFSGDPHVVVRRVRSEDPPAPTERDPSLPDAVDDLLARAMAKRKPERYETVDDLRVAFSRLVASRDPELTGRIS